MKDHNVTKEKMDKLKEVLSYFEEVVLCTPTGSYFLYSVQEARCDERLYIHGIKVDPEHR